MGWVSERIAMYADTKNLDYVGLLFFPPEGLESSSSLSLVFQYLKNAPGSAIRSGLIL